MRQSINRLCNYRAPLQTNNQRLCSSPCISMCKNKYLLYQWWDETKGWKTLWFYFGRWQIKDTHISTCIHMCPTCAVIPHTPNKCAWKVTEVSHCHYTAHGCHFIVSHQYITQTKICSRMRANTHTHTDTPRQDDKIVLTQTVWRHQLRELQNLLCCFKTNCFFSCGEAPTASANEYKHSDDGWKAVCSCGVILAAESVSCLLRGKYSTIWSFFSF